MPWSNVRCPPAVDVLANEFLSVEGRLTVVLIVAVVWYMVAILSSTVAKASVPLFETWTRVAIKVVYLEPGQQLSTLVEQI